MDADKALLFAKILGVAGGLGIVAVVILLFLELRKNRDKTEGDAPADKPTRPLTEMLGQFFKRPAPAAPPNAHEVLRVARDNLTGRLSVELAGQRFNRFEEIGDEALRQALLTTVRDLEKFTDTAPPATVSVPVVSPAPAAPPPPAPSVQPAAVPTALPTPPVAASTPTELPPLPKPSMNPFKQRQILRELEKRPAPVFKSIPEIIDEHLQQKLLGTPHIWRGIRVKPGPKDSVQFEVDGQAYDAVDAVPDEAVRALLREAIAEWDAKK